jgi:hypothetical protein
MPFKSEYVNVDTCLPTCLFVKLHGCLKYSAYTNYIKNYNPNTKSFNRFKFWFKKLVLQFSNDL